MRGKGGLVGVVNPFEAPKKTPLARALTQKTPARHDRAKKLNTPAMKYSELLAVVHKLLAEEWGVSALWEECVAYGNSVKDWPAFPDSAEALKYLKQHYKLAILSNIDNQSFAHSNLRLGVEFDAIYTAEHTASSRPSPGKFDY